VSKFFVVIVRTGRNHRTYLLIRDRVVWMGCIDMDTILLKQHIIVNRAKALTTRTKDGSHGMLLPIP
jgi:hypothetical protein